MSSLYLLIQMIWFTSAGELIIFTNSNIINQAHHYIHSFHPSNPLLSPCYIHQRWRFLSLPGTAVTKFISGSCNLQYGDFDAYDDFVHTNAIFNILHACNFVHTNTILYVLEMLCIPTQFCAYQHNFQCCAYQHKFCAYQHHFQFCAYQHETANNLVLFSEAVHFMRTWQLETTWPFQFWGIKEETGLSHTSYLSLASPKLHWT